MAADEETPAPEGRPPKRGPARRPKPPMTIDLEAAPAVSDTGAPAAEPPEPPVEDLAEEPADPMGPEPSVPPASAIPPPVPPPARQGHDWLALLIAAIAGGILATLFGIVGHSTGLFPSPVRETAEAASARAQEASDGLAALANRFAALEAVAASAKVGEGRVADLEKSTTALADRVARLEAIPASPGTPGPDLKPELAALSARIDRLEAEAVGGSSGDGQLLADLRGRLAALEASSQALTNRLAALEAHPAASAPAGEGGKAALAIAITALRQSSAAGGAFDHDLAMLDVLGVPAEALAALRPLAAKGAPTRKELVEEFPNVADHVLASVADASGSGGFLGQLGAFASGFVSVRPTGPIAGDTPEAIVSRMRDAVEHGDLARALAEREALPKVAVEASAAWAQAAADREAIDRLVDKLAASVLPAPAAGQ